MQPPTPSPIAFDDVLIDVVGHRLLRGGTVQPLEPKAFGVLALLAQAPGRVFARDDILDAVWGHRHVTPGVLNRVMTLLRHALGEDAHAPHYLHTVHGVGYRFDLRATESPPPASPWPEPPVSASAIADTAPALQATGSTPQRGNSDLARPRRARLALLWLLPLLAVAGYAGWRLWPGPATPDMPQAPVPVTDRSIAVLPLTNASRDPDQQFFSDGLSENLIITLSQFPGLKVVGRMSSFQFRDSKADARVIGSRLGVTRLLEGSVQHAGDAVRIRVQLIDTRDGSTLWSQRYDRPYKDLFALQDEIASAVAHALQAKLLPTSSAAKQDDRPPSGNIEAYTAYLQGLQHWHDEDFPKAAEYMAKAVQLDPGYAVAWAHLSGSWSTVATFWNEPPAVAREHLRISRLAADKALQQAPELGSAHAARAYLLFYDFDYRGALAECRRAVQLAPDDGTVLNGCGYTLTGIGKLGEAIRLREHLISIEPLYNVNYFQYARLLMATGRLDEAEKALRTGEEVARPNPLGHLKIAVLRGDENAALEIARRASPHDRKLFMALAAQIGPDRAVADKSLADMLADKIWVEQGGSSDDNRYRVAEVYALRGNAGDTLDWLERNLAAKPPRALFLLADPILLRFRDDPRFIALCRKLGLPPPRESEALSIDQIRAALAAKQ